MRRPPPFKRGAARINTLSSSPPAMPVAKLWRLAERKGSRVIVALDLVPERPSKLVEGIADYVAGVKVGLPLLLTWGLDELRDLAGRFSDELYLLCDFKLADVPFIMVEELRLIARLGFDGAVVHLFQGGVESVASALEDLDLFGVVAMTHRESQLIDAHTDELVEAALRAGLEGCVVPATKPEVIRRVRSLAPRMVLLSPGVGAQGAPIGSAVAAGADFEIVGRAVVAHADPPSAARAARDAVRAALLRAGFK